jgi:hypothetical protein
MLGPSHKVEFSQKQLRALINQLKEGILQIDRNRGKAQEESYQNLENIVKSFRGNRFTYIAGSERGNTKDT